MARRTLFGIVVFAMWWVAVTTSVGQQQAAPTAGPRFEVVSIKPSASETRNSTVTDRLDGGIRAINRALYTLIARVSAHASRRDPRRARLGEDRSLRRDGDGLAAASDTG